jgi:hypothetical protein
MKSSIVCLPLPSGISSAQWLRPIDRADHAATAVAQAPPCVSKDRKTVLRNAAAQLKKRGSCTSVLLQNAGQFL